MFCTKCGREMADNEACVCQTPEPAQQPRQAAPPPAQPIAAPPAQHQPQYQQPPVQQAQPQYQQQPVQQAQPQYQQPPVQQAQPQYQQPPVQPPPQYQQQQGQQYQQPNYQQQYAYNTPPKDNRKLYSILAYIPGLFLIGMLSSDVKNDPRVRFNVGQGIMYSIVSGGMIVFSSIITALINALWTKPVFNYYGYSFGRVPTVGAGIVSGIFWLAALAFIVTFMLIGIMGVSNNREKPLPIIGSMAFYK